MAYLNLIVMTVHPYLELWLLGQSQLGKLHYIVIPYFKSSNHNVLLIHVSLPEWLLTSATLHSNTFHSSCYTV